MTATIGLQLFAVIFNFAGIIRIGLPFGMRLVSLFSISEFTDWIIYTESGDHEIFFPIIATLFEVVGQSVFLLLLLVLAQGWCVQYLHRSFPTDFR